MTTAILSNDQLRKAAPSIFAASPWERMSTRYRLLPTIDVVDMLRETGFFPVRASQSKCRTLDRRDFSKHMLRFRRDADIADPTSPEVPEVVLINSFDGTSAFRFLIGVFRAVCSNGLVIQSADYGSISVRHSGAEDLKAQVIDATHRVLDDAPRVIRQIETWKEIPLTAPQQLAFANAAMEIRDADAGIKPAQLLEPRRKEDSPAEDGSRSLWVTGNCVQEALTKGGLRGRSKSGRRTTTRPIKAVDSDIRTNRAVWRLMAEMEKLV